MKRMESLRVLFACVWVCVLGVLGGWGGGVGLGSFFLLLFAAETASLDDRWRSSWPSIDRRRVTHSTSPLPYPPPPSSSSSSYSGPPILERPSGVVGKMDGGKKKAKTSTKYAEEIKVNKSAAAAATTTTTTKTLDSTPFISKETVQFQNSRRNNNSYAHKMRDHGQ